MKVIIEDALGVYSGIQIQNVSNRIEPEKDHIIVYGELVARHDLSVANYYGNLFKCVRSTWENYLQYTEYTYGGILDYAQDNIFTKNRRTE